ncbi:GSCFA domain-containing protein [Spongiimicrobium sp. 3-5]|uniref:GSCFA domain-containing protein n=1 Tax=Spongiimicrobium sp. 3-5 TaxID=3332596 RepID=UPI0039818361
MKLQTLIPLAKEDNPITYQSRLLLLGSCFSEHIGEKLNYYRFKTFQNPLGILFQPKAIEKLISYAVEGKVLGKQDIFEHNGLWHCFDAHSDLSSTKEDDTIKQLNGQLEATREALKQATHIIITLGTAWVYKHKKTGSLVANCHKVPQKEFSKELLTIREIAQSLQKSMQLIRSINPRALIVLTVSPVRHLKDGFVQNQQGKAHLISAVHNVLANEDAVYFPSYEIVMDELRDYRFYAADMVHPNALAVNYIWEKFRDAWIAEEMFSTMDEINTVQKGLLHRPFNPETEQHRQFISTLNAKIAYLKKKYPFMEFNS